MNKFNPLPVVIHPGTRAMMFVDGENLACRYKDMLGSDTPMPHVLHVPDVAVWTGHANLASNSTCCVLRRYYYTTSSGDDDKVQEASDNLRRYGIEQPHVFKKIKSRRTKGVDISVTTDMLSHAHMKNYDLAILVAGDGDFVPLVNAVKATGSRVFLWALESG
jgi:uncharacterized LabA/DUF88 family protein